VGFVDEVAVEDDDDAVDDDDEAEDDVDDADDDGDDDGDDGKDAFCGHINRVVDVDGGDDVDKGVGFVFFFTMYLMVRMVVVVRW
jgi:hypothetical protein